MTSYPAGHWNGEVVVCLGAYEHFFLNLFPQEQDFPATEWFDVVLSFKKNGVFQALPNGATVVFDSTCQLFSC